MMVINNTNVCVCAWVCVWVREFGYMCGCMGLGGWVGARVLVVGKIAYILVTSTLCAVDMFDLQMTILTDLPSPRVLTDPAIQRQQLFSGPRHQ